MKQCPACNRKYSDETLNFCLDDGAALIYGPAESTAATADLTGQRFDSDAVTEILFPPRPSDGGRAAITEPDRSSGIKPQNRDWALGAGLAILVLAGFLSFRHFYSAEADATGPAAPAAEPPGRKLYWEMREPEQSAFVRDRARQIQSLIGDDPADFDDEAVEAIRLEIADFVRRKDSLSQKPFEEGLRVIYGRATQYAPLVVKAYEARQVPSALGLYQAMIESEYRDCPTSPYTNGPVGMFQFSRKTGARYGLTPADYCDVAKQSDAAARYMSDLSSDFGEGRSNATLGLLSYAMGENGVREYLRIMRGKGIVERSYWALLRNRKTIDPDLDLVPPPEPLLEREFNYVPRFFAAAIIGETPSVFELSTPPLTSLKGSE